MISTSARVVAVAVACAGVVLAGCSDDKKTAAPPVTTLTVTAEPADESPSPDESFDVTLVPATPEPTDTTSSLSATGAASSTAPASSAPASSAGATNPPIVAGRVFAFLKSVDLTKRTLTYDEAQFLTGDAAKKAAAADGKELDTDYYIRNVNKRLRTLPVSSSAAILGSIAMSGQVPPQVVTLERLAEFVATPPGKETGFWVTIKDKKAITRVQEQYIP
ncbi:MAG: hypothetical protein ABIM89_00025 [Mycobacteriales bacterium]